MYFLLLLFLNPPAYIPTPSLLLLQFSSSTPQHPSPPPHFTGLILLNTLPSLISSSSPFTFSSPFSLIHPFSVSTLQQLSLTTGNIKWIWMVTLPSRKRRSQMVSTVSQQGRVVKRHMNQEVTYMSGCIPRLSWKCKW